MNGSGYNQAEPQLINAIDNNGHTVVVNNNNLSILPPNFTTACIDPVNGFDWLCFFGDTDYTMLIPEIQSFIDSGGKVFYQYEVECCNVSSNSVSNIISSLTNLSITPNSTPFIAYPNSLNSPGWESTDNCCVRIMGAAYKGLDGIPPANQLLATSTLNGASPSITTCQNYGCLFTGNDFIGSSNKGVFLGIGDINVWYKGHEPFWNGGNTNIDSILIDYIFPNNSSSCYLFAHGCADNLPNGQTTLSFNLGKDTTLCQGDTLVLSPVVSNGIYNWQDSSNDSTFTIHNEGSYWVNISNDCGYSTDTIVIDFLYPPQTNLLIDTSICPKDSLILCFADTSVNYIWNDASTGISLVVYTPGIYWVDVSNFCGNIIDSVVVDYGDCDPILVIPNIFTPNGDGSNDFFIPNLQKGINAINTTIYDRWGLLVYHSNFLNIGWDGRTFNGKLVPDGTYFWIISYEDYFGLSKTISGHLTLMK